MNTKRKILFICGNIYPYSSQGVRYSNILLFFNKKYNLYTLSYNSFLHDLIQNSFYIHNESTLKAYAKKEYSFLKKYLINFYKNYTRQYIFPDKYIFQLKKYYQKIDEILELNPDISVIIIGMTPFSLYYLAKYIKIHYSSIKIIVDLSDPFSLNGNIKYAWIHGSGKRLTWEKNMLKFVDAVVVLNPFIKDLYSNKLGFANTFVIEQGIKKHTNTLSHNKDQKQQTTLLYAGGLYKEWREAFELYEAVKLINNNEIRLYIYGNIKEELLPKSNNEHIFYKGIIDVEKLQKEYINSDIIVFIDNKTGYQVPGKLFEILILKKPVLFIYENEKSPTLHYIRGIDYVTKVKNNRYRIIEGIDRLKNLDITKISDCDFSKYYWHDLMLKYYNIIND